MTLRVTHVIDSLAPSGGAENRLVDEVVALAGRYDQTVVRLFEPDALEPRLTDAGVPVVSLGFRSSHAGRTWPAIALRLRSELGRNRPDVLHTSLFTGNLVGQLAAASLRVPVLSTFNRTGELSLQRELQAGVASWKGRSMQAIGRWSARRGDVHYRAVGDYARQTNCSSMGLPLDRSTVVPRGVSMGPSDLRADRAAFGLPDGVPLYANVGRRVPEKAQHLLVRAFALVRGDLPDAHLAIAGPEGAADDAIHAAIDETDAGDAVHLLGFRTDARALISAADVFAFSSLSEGSPGVVVEALTLGTPIAAFDLQPVSELTDGVSHARLAPAGAVEALAEAMLAAYRDPDRRRRAAAAQRWAERYALAAVAGQLGELLETRAGRVVPAPMGRQLSPPDEESRP